MADPASYRPTDIPKLPGVYRFYDASDSVIYVGKAVNLKNRLSNYFQANLPEKTFRMVHQAVRVDWTIVDTEVEALQLEFSWIKQYAPQFNVQFRDDKTYPYLAVTNNEEYPRIFITRKSKRPGITYFGPFTHTWALRSTFDVILKVFPIRSCSSGNFQRAQRSKRQCLLGDIGKCAAPCVKWVSQAEHKELAKRLIAFMGDSNADIVPTLKAEMKLASEREEFERATKIRDSITAIERAQESADARLPDSLTADVVAIYRDGVHAAGSIFIVRGGAIKGSRSWIVDQSKSLEGDDEMGALFYSIYSQSAPSEIPAQILINERPLDAPALEAWLSELRGGPVALRTPQRGEKVELLATVQRNAQYSLIQFLSKRSNDAAVT
ncbi:MAG: excinuclease ABC subunit UvrC, partial [Actinobacteria bacterium]|nr:excinuclease ABC subunit UvrC [Actinomycetota bacterium]